MSRESALAAARAAIPQPAASAPEAELVAPTTDAPSPDPTLSPEVPLPDAARFAAIARKETEFVRQQLAFKREQEAHKQTRAAEIAETERAREIIKKAQSFEELRKTDHIAAFKALGYTDTDIFNLMASIPEKKEPSPAELAAKTAEEVTQAALKKFQEDADKRAQEQQKNSDAEKIQGLKTEITRFRETQKETLPYCNFFGEQAEVQAYENILAVLAESKGTELISVKEAFELTEQFYQEQDEAMAALRKVKSAPQAEVQAPQARTRTVTASDPALQQKPVITRVRSPSNADRPGAQVSAPRKESREELKARLAARITAHGLRK
jgi:hypothetical protein